MWQVIRCPAKTTFTRILKEGDTHGNVYAIWECEGKSPCWICQSIPVLVRVMNQRFKSVEKHLHEASIYRILRGEGVGQTHKCHQVTVFERDEIDAFNELILKFPACWVITKSPDNWVVKTAKEFEQDTEEDTEDTSLQKWMRIIRTGKVGLWRIFRGWATIPAV